MMAFIVTLSHIYLMHFDPTSPLILSCLILLFTLRRLSSLHLIFPGHLHRPEECFLVDFNANQTDSQD